MHGGCHVYQLRVLPDFLSRRQVRQSDEGGGGAAEQPAKLNTRDSELRGGDRLSTLFAHESTPEGEGLYRHIKIACTEIEAGEAAVTQSRTLERGNVFLAASEGALRCLLLPVLKRYQEKYPGVHLRISNHSTPQAVAALHETTADFAVITTPVTLSPSLTQTIVKEIREVPICAPAFSGLLGRSVALSELEAYPLITLGAGTTSHAFYVSVFTAQGVAFQPAIEAATADQIIPMAEAGLGVGIVPEAFIRPSDNVRRIELQEPLPLRAVCIVKRKGQPLSVAARELERMLLAAGAQST